MAGLARKFGGKIFRFFDSYKDRSEADAVATSLRREGKNARITRPKDRLLPYYEVWTR